MHSCNSGKNKRGNIVKRGLKLSKKRSVYTFCFFAVFIVALCLRLGYIQVIKGDEYKAMAETQQTRNRVVTADRGKILDRNGEVLAASATSYIIWARPADIEAEQRDAAAAKLAKILKLDKKELKEKLAEKSVLVKLAKDIDEKTMKEIREADLSGIEIEESSTRYYPLKTMASQVVGNVSEEGEGLAGLELQYNDELSGISGRQLEKTDSAGRALSYGTSDSHGAADGLNVVTTLDDVIQSHAEDGIKKGKADTGADKVMCLMMNPKTGEILASATTEGYDPNNARVPLDPSEAARLEKMSSEEKMEYWNKMWRNPIVSDTYEPGSTFKLLTLSAALEERKSSLGDSFYCSGSYNVDGTKLRCWSYADPHGDENLKQAVGNSCNPVFIQLGKRLGTDLFYKYLDLFGITEKTGIDYPGETGAQIKDKSSLTSVDFATMAYGQGISVTPVQLLAAVSAIGNDGVLVKPHLVKELTDTKGKTVKAYGTEVVRQAISKETADEVKEAMEYVVEENGGTAAKVKGYSMGGKTGTAQNESRGLSSHTYYASFVGMAPIDDPEIAVLVVVDNPKGAKTHGSDAAAPIVKEIMQNVLPYLESKAD